MSKLKAVVTDYGFPNLRQEKEVLEPLGFTITAGQCKQEEEVLELAHDADAILTQWAPITAAVIEKLTRCRVIVRYGIGVDNVDLKAAKEKGIPVANVPDYAIDEVADHTLSLLLSLVRKIPQIVRNVKQGIWEIAPCRPIIGLQGKTLGLAGFGNISKAVARRAKVFGMQVIAFDPYVPNKQFEELMVQQVAWEDLLTNSDVISVHLPLTESTKYKFNLDAFRAMKPASFIVNTSRGGVVDTEGLTQALQSDEIAGAALDVLEEEPLTIDHPLIQMEQCLITSHCAWYSEDSLRKLQLYAAQEVARRFNGQRLKHVVNDVLY